MTISSSISLFVSIDWLSGLNSLLVVHVKYERIGTRMNSFVCYNLDFFKSQKAQQICYEGLYRKQASAP
jgi:hypothetical protein